jgi:L-alanine-DL-glutamate epimerase-like enolase superfamily enzyme
MYQCGNFWCRVGLGTIVINGIEAALWDLKGKLEDKPGARAPRRCQV